MPKTWWDSENKYISLEICGVILDIYSCSISGRYMYTIKRKHIFLVLILQHSNTPVPWWFLTAAFLPIWKKHQLREAFPQHKSVKNTQPNEGSLKPWNHNKSKKSEALPGCHRKLGSMGYFGRPKQGSFYDTNPNFMHLYWGNPTKLPYIVSIKFYPDNLRSW